MERRYTHLLLVDVESVPYVVDGGRESASMGDLVQFSDGKDLLTGECMMANFVERDGSDYNFISALHPIYPMKRYWRLTWEAEETNTGD